MMKRYIYTIAILIIVLLTINAIVNKKELDYVVNEYKSIQQEKTSLIEEIRNLKNENSALKSVIEN